MGQSDLHPKTHLRAAAWVPDLDDMDWDDASELAADWILDRADVEQIKPLLVTVTLGVTISDALRPAAAGGHVTPLSKNRMQKGPVLVYTPDQKTLDFALGLAHGSSLVVIEGFGFPLKEWAAAANAIDLTTGTAPESALSDRARTDLDSAVFFGGNNGWSGQHEKDHARRHLSGHVRTGALSPQDAAAYVLAQGVSARGAQRLEKLLALVR